VKIVHTDLASGASRIDDGTIENKWNNEVDETGEYTMWIGYDTTSTASISGDPGSLSEAWEAARNTDVVQTALDDHGYDVVIVRDDRSFDQGDGYGHIDTAGTGDGVAYVTSDNLGLAMHELGHVYGGTHDTHENFGWFSVTIMASTSDPGLNCHDNTTDEHIEATWSSCSQEEFRSNSVF
jgi:hypothetical protein